MIWVMNFCFNYCTVVTAVWEDSMEFGTGVTSIPTWLGLLALRCGTMGCPKEHCHVTPLMVERT